MVVSIFDECAPPGLGVMALGSNKNNIAIAPIQESSRVSKNWLNVDMIMINRFMEKKSGGQGDYFLSKMQNRCQS